MPIRPPLVLDLFFFFLDVVGGGRDELLLPPLAGAPESPTCPCSRCARATGESKLGSSAVVRPSPLTTPPDKVVASLVTEGGEVTLPA